MESVGRTRKSLEEWISRFSDSPRTLVGWPKKLQVEVERKLLEGDGAEGLAEARRLADQLPAIDQVLAVRREHRDGPAAKVGSQMDDGLRERHETAMARLQEGDSALVEDRLGAARRLYDAAVTDFCEALLALGKTDLEAGRFAAAGERFQAVLKVRPGDATADRWAEIGGRLAQVKELHRSGDRARR